MPHYQDTPDQFITVNGARLHYLDWGGKGEVLLFLPGIGEPASVFKWFAPRFLPEFRPVALTRRGTGESQILPGTYFLSQLVDDIHAFIEACSFPSICAVGHSYGGFEITRLASLYPDRVRKLVYLDALYSQESMVLIAEDPVADQLLPALPSSALNSFHDYFSYIRASYPFVDRHWALPFEEAWRVDVEVALDGRLREIDRDAALSEMMSSATKEPLDFTNLRCPVLVIEAFEQHHPNLPREADKDLREKAEHYHQRRLRAKRATIDAIRQQKPDARVVELNDAPHHLYLTHADEVYAQMAAFLAPQAAQRSA